jgi:phosphate starvation-inducible PhoH-like protein
MQKKYMDALNSKIPIVIGCGPAGTGKTYFACLQAMDELIKGNVNQIIITRPTITVNSEEFGFLPGGISPKMGPFMRPIFDVLCERMDEAKLNTLIRNKKIEICPLAFMRGRTFKNTFIIADEMQNSDISQMTMILTRLGENARIVITGDQKQSDLRKYPNGLTDLVTRVKNAQDPLIQCFELTESDVVRSLAVQSVLRLYKDNEQ